MRQNHFAQTIRDEFCALERMVLGRTFMPCSLNDVLFLVVAKWASR